ncbi:MAG TPA: GIY-YIG nuclease family protein [Bacteroidetes bacterium]|nr:GIY-YIG nuclease family protein [Bacteroidota bacterium]
MTDRPLPKTIQIFLPDGNPRSVRIAEITSRTVRAVEVPRTKLAVAAERDEVRQVGLYFLFGESEEEAKPRAYIGESEDCLTRLGQHHQRKDFWTRAVVVTSKTQRFDKAQARWLEWHAEREAARVGRYTLDNAVSPSEPHISEPVRADLLDTFGTVRVLLATLGFPIFENAHAPAAPSEREVFACEGRGARGRAEYVEDGLLVLAGSQAAKTVTASTRGAYAEKIRAKLLASGVLTETETHYVFAQDHLFTTPTAAAVAVIGRRTNGWKAWKDDRGRTLDELKRQPLTPGR